MSSSQEESDRTTAVALRIPSELAEKIESLLRDFAEESELDMALVVDRSGAMIAGITAEEIVSTETLSALVAAATGAVNALAAELGESGSIESLHRGRDRSLYLREVEGRYILTGVAEAAIPAGIVREEAVRIEEELASHLREIETASTLPGAEEGKRVLRSLPRSPEPEHGKAEPREEEEPREWSAVNDWQGEESEPVTLKPSRPQELDTELDTGIPGETTLLEGLAFEHMDNLTDPGPGEDRETLEYTPEPAEEGGEEQGVAGAFENAETASIFELDEDAGAFGLENEEEPVPGVSGALPEEGAGGDGVEPETSTQAEGPVEPEAETGEALPPPVLVSPIVVDSPFEVEEEEAVEEIVEDEEDEEDEEVKLAIQPGPAILPPSVETPPSSGTGRRDQAQPDENSGNGPSRRKSGPRYSFDLG